MADTFELVDEEDAAVVALTPMGVLHVRQVGRLDSLSSVAEEIAKVYRLTWRGKVAPETATKMTYVLKELRAALEAAVVEQRLAALEELVKANAP